MAIDWGRVAKGVATGYLGAKIANTEANDAMNADIIKRAGLNFYENELPEWHKSEKNRKIAYDKISSLYGPDVAEWMGQNKHITGDGNDLANIQNMLSERGIDKDKLKAMIGSEYIIVDHAMRYGNPSIKSKIIKLKDQGCENIVI